MTKTIVWIEDDIDIIAPVIEPLKRIYHIEAVTTMQEALDRIDLLCDADLILLDILLPTGTSERPADPYTGVQLLELLRAQDVATPVLVFSVVGNEEVDRKLRALGIEGYVRKPVLPSRLKERVEKIFEASVDPK